MVIVHIYSPSTWEVEQEDQGFLVTLDYIASSKWVWTYETLQQINFLF